MIYSIHIAKSRSTGMRANERAVVYTLQSTKLGTLERHVAIPEGGLLYKERRMKYSFSYTYGQPI